MGQFWWKASAPSDVDPMRTSIGGHMSCLDHERLDVYRKSLEFLVLSDELCRQLPTGRAYLSDQLRRASLSVVLNIAEGAGEFSKAEKSRFYRMAKRSATECAAVLDCLHMLRLGRAERAQDGKSLLVDVVAMLIKMASRAS
ncbi:MAG: four helix bundle protein [Bradymonadia bacterium]